MLRGFGARLHAFTHRLFRSRDVEETKALFMHAVERFEAHGLISGVGREAAIAASALKVCEGLDIDPKCDDGVAIAELVSRLIDYEQIWCLPLIDWSERRDTSTWWQFREEITRQKVFADDFFETTDLLIKAITEMLQPMGLKSTESASASEYDLKVRTSAIHRVTALPAALETMLQVPNGVDIVEASIFRRTHAQMMRNQIVISGGTVGSPETYPRSLVQPSKSSIKDPTELASSYLRDTPWLEFVCRNIEFTVPTNTRFEHMHIVAGTGHGKSQTLQYLIANDLPAVAAGKRSVVVIDSQGDLIENISKLALFAPGGALADRLVLIDPTDVQYPVSLNMFDVGKERLQQYEALERERLTNSIIELYDFVLGSLLDAGMTQKQSVIFRYVTRLMLEIDDATIHTLRELMEEGSEEVFASDIAKLSGTARRFFETEFGDREFKQTRKQVLRRLWGILENQTFERMFSHPVSKLDLFSEMNAGKVILINTAKDLLKEQGTQIFGRFFIAMIAQAAQERATLKSKDRLPTFVYVDEAADYFDQNIGIILSQARKYNVGMVLAHQYLGQLDSKLQETFGANTSIKLAGGVSAKDARSLAPMLYCQPEFIERQAKGSFAAHVRGVASTAVPLQFPFGHMESLDTMSEVERRLQRDDMRQRYAVHVSDLSAGSNARASGASSNNEPPEISIEPTEEW